MGRRDEDSYNSTSILGLIYDKVMTFHEEKDGAIGRLLILLIIVNQLAWRMHIVLLSSTIMPCCWCDITVNGLFVHLLFQRFGNSPALLPRKFLNHVFNCGIIAIASTYKRCLSYVKWRVVSVMNSKIRCLEKFSGNINRWDTNLLFLSQSNTKANMCL